MKKIIRFLVRNGTEPWFDDEWTPWKDFKDVVVPETMIAMETKEHMNLKEVRRIYPDLLSKEPEEVGG